MRLSHRRSVRVMLVCLFAAACSSQKIPAQKLIEDIDAAVNAAPDAAKYVPDDLMDVQKKAGGLRASFDKQDYKSVVQGAPAVLAAARALASSTAVKKVQENKTLRAQWNALAAEVPGNLHIVQSRVDFLSRRENKKLASGVDLDAVRVSLTDAESSWASALRANAAGHVDEALASGNGAKNKLQALAASMKVDFSQPAAVKDTSPDQ